MSELRERYFETLGLSDSKPPRKLQECALDRAYRLRTFEIELYWKRATYFWGFQVAIFTAFGLLWRGDSASDWGPITLALAGLGILTALANCLSALGSKFWQENWEKHIDMLEDEIDGCLYKTVWLQNEKRGYSVTRINLQLSRYFVVFWLLTTVYVALKLLGWLEPSWGLGVIWYCVYGLMIISIFGGALWLFCQKTDLRGTLRSPDGSDLPTKWRSCWSKHIDMSERQTFVRRHAPGEEHKS